MTMLKKRIAEAAALYCDGSGAEYPRLKYEVARILAEHLALEHPWIREIYYADLSSGEVVRGLSDGSDIDLMVITSGPPGDPSLIAKHLEITLNTLIADALHEVSPDAAERARRHGILEIHIDDMYARLVARKARRGGLSSLNAIRLWPPQK